MQNTSNECTLSRRLSLPHYSSLKCTFEYFHENILFQNGKGSVSSLIRKWQTLLTIDNCNHTQRPSCGNFRNFRIVKYTIRTSAWLPIHTVKLLILFAKLIDLQKPKSIVFQPISSLQDHKFIQNLSSLGLWRFSTVVVFFAGYTNK